MKVAVVPGDDGATSVVVADDGGTRAVRRLRLALDLRQRSRRARAPPGAGAADEPELKAGLAGDVLCVEYRET